MFNSPKSSDLAVAPVQHRYEHAEDVNNPNSSVYKVLNLVGHGKRVLELGPGNGSITRYLAERQNCQVYAIELDVECAELVAPWCEDVLVHDLADLNWISWAQTHFVGSDGFDAIVIADVLEHLIAPDQLLQACPQLLGPRGSVVISLPVSGHSALIASLLKGRFTYQRHGLLDATHLRFFGLPDIQALVGSSKLDIVDASFVTKHPLETEFADFWVQLSPIAKYVVTRHPHAFVYQVVFRALPTQQRTLDPTKITVDLTTIAANRPALLESIRWIAVGLARKHLSSHMRTYLRRLFTS
jgi:2-polyprenyl-3-methyl-5-hydroxy-6-metoxy-1,4-benzoquinol methylase